MFAHVPDFESLIERWDGEEVVIHFDRPSGSWMFVCIHSTVLGPAGGGTRMRVYDTPAGALADGMKLSAAMTRKMAVVDVPRGGGKAVLAVREVPAGEERAALLLRYGDLVQSLGGTYRTACDMNTTPEDMDVIAERCAYVYGRSEATGGPGSSGVGTARGVFHGIRASVRHVYGSDTLHGRTVLVQGVGSVGARLAGQLADDGAQVVVADVSAEAARAVAERVGARVVAADAATGTECDVFAPCAVGGVLDAESIPRLRCRIVAGAANNQLASPADAERLRDAGILYAPDFVINAGGVIQLVALEDFGWDADQLEEKLRSIGDVLAELYGIAQSEGITTDKAAEGLVAARLAAAADATQPLARGATGR